MILKLLTSLLLSLLLVSCSNENNLKYYQPLYFDGNSYGLNETLTTEKHFDNVELVLSFYEVSYRREASLLIKFDKPLLDEIVFNYGEKAENKKWLTDRGFKKK